MTLANSPTFATLRCRFDWADIPNCPGRSRLVQPSDELDSLVQRHGRRLESALARDPFWVLYLPDQGALLSYERARGFLHTLNTPDGIERKLLQLNVGNAAPSSS